MFRERSPRWTGKICNNTSLERRGDAFAVRLHATDVITFHADGRIELNSGGWLTITTKGRINGVIRPLGFSVYSGRGAWYLSGHGADAPRYPYADGITIHADGTVTGASEDSAADVRRIKRSAREFAKRYLAAFWRGEVAAPGPGDCFCCALRPVDGGRSPLGGASHVREHIREGYYVPSLLARAVERFPVSQAAQHCLAVAWNPEAAAAQGITLAETLAGFFGRIGGEQLQKSLYRFICTEFGLAV